MAERQPEEKRSITKNKTLQYAFPAFIVLCVGLFFWFVVQASTSGGVYDMSLADLEENKSEYVGKDVRVSGVVQEGSYVEHDGDAINIEFVIGDSEGNTLRVRYRQLVPDAFEEGRQVIVQGKLVSEDEVECDRLTVKCPSKYKDENQVGQPSPSGSSAPAGGGAYGTPVEESNPPQ